MFRRDRKGRRGGFTMAEVLTVVAIVGILAAIAIPSVIAYQRALKLTELDDNARTIYLAAQNNLAALRSASGGTLETDGRAADVTAAGVTIPGTAGWKYVLTKDSSADPDWLVLPGSVDGALMEEDSYYLVEFDPASGVVYGVFYSETKSGTRGAQLTASNYKTLSESGCRTRSGRNAFATDSSGFWVGYYGADGELDLSRPDAQKLPLPKLKLTNAEELALEFSAKAEGTVNTDKIFYSVSVSGFNASGTMATKELVPQGKFFDDKTNTVVLDTLKSYTMTPDSSVYDPWTVGASFSNWVKEPSGGLAIAPGADITVTVTTWYQPDGGEGLTALPQSASVKTNSLFAARNGETAHIAYGRHLQNLDPGTSDVDSAVTAAKQIREIDFDATGDAVRYYWKSCYPDKKFTPIANTNLTHYDGQGFVIRNLDAIAQSGKNAGLFDTLDAATVEGVVLVDAKASAPGQSAGALAGVAKGNTQVKDCQVYITATGSTYSTATRISGANAGGLIGWAQNCAVENSFASTVVHGTQNTGNTGGLVGRSSNVNIKTSYAAGRLSGPRVGGLVGGGSGVTMTDCYAAGLLVPDANGEAAGLCAAEVNNATRCYAAADYTTAAGTSYTIVGAVPGGTCKNVYYLAKSGVNDAATVAGVERVASSDQMTKNGGGALAAFTAFKTSAAKTYPYNHVTRTEEEGPLKPPYPYPALGDLPHYGDWLESTAPSVTSLVAYYEQFLSDAGYVTEYSAFVDGAELGAIKNATRTEAINADGYAFLSTEKLHNDGQETAKLTVKAVGTETKETSMDARYLGALDEELNYTSGEATYYVYAIPTEALDVVPVGRYVELHISVSKYIPGYNIEGTEENGWTWWVPERWELEEKGVAWANTFFGRAAYNGAKPTADPDPIHIRSLRQLANIGRYYGTPNYVQDLDIDAQIYVGDLLVDCHGNTIQNAGRAENSQGHATIAGFEVWGRQSWSPTWSYVGMYNIPAEYHLVIDPIGAHDEPGGTSGGYEKESSFNGTYDGNGRIIRALSIRSHHYSEGSSSTDLAGLFHRVRGNLKNIHISDCDVVGATGTAANATGVLAARLSKGEVINCTVTDCTVTAEGSKANGHMGGLIGYVDDKAQAISGCKVENCTVDGGQYIRNVGGLIGYINKLNSGKIQNCTVKNVPVSGNFISSNFAKGNAESIEKQGSMGGFVGCLSDSTGPLENCLVIGTGDFGVSGSAWNAGGFAGSISGGTVQGCGVRLEGTRVASNYQMQAVSGGKLTGGFVGALSDAMDKKDDGTLVLKTVSSIQSSYAAVKADGDTAGGFAGSQEGGSISNCYAGGHTQGGRYIVTKLSVIGATRAGGFTGLWKGGSLGTCYTTCAVSGPNDMATDVFANQEAATLNSPVPNCYALGEAYVNKITRGKLTKTGVAVNMTKLDAAQRTETHPYDTTLTTYPYAPVKYADGTSVPHYGDWPKEKAAGDTFEWNPVPNEVPDANMDYIQNVEAKWEGESLTLTFDTKSTVLSDLFTENGGTFVITTDLGYVRTLDVTKNGTEVTISDGLGNTWVVHPVVVDSIKVNGSVVEIWEYSFTLPSSLIPPYKESISIGGFQQGAMVDAENEKPDATENKPTTAFKPGDTITIDGDFDDWLGYTHHLLAYGGTGTAAHTAVGAAYGEGTTIYLHVKNEYTLVDVPYSDVISRTNVLRDIQLIVEGDPEWSGRFDDWQQSFMNQPYTGPGKYIWTKKIWDTDTWQLLDEYVAVEAYLEVKADGSQEMEMVIYMDAIAGKEAADKIYQFTTRFSAIGGSTLTIERDLPQD